MMRESRNLGKSISVFLNQYLIYYVLLSAGRFTRAEEFGKIVFQSLARSRCQTCIEQYDGSLPSVFWRISFCWWFRRYWTARAELLLKPLPRADIMASIGARYQNHCVSDFDQPTISLFQVCLVFILSISSLIIYFIDASRFSSHSSFLKKFSISPSTLIKKCTARPKKTYQFQVLFDFTHSLCSRACTLTFCVIWFSPWDIVDTCILWAEKIITFTFLFYN